MLYEGNLITWFYVESTLSKDAHHGSLRRNLINLALNLALILVLILPIYLSGPSTGDILTTCFAPENNRHQPIEAELQIQTICHLATQWFKIWHENNGHTLWSNLKEKVSKIMTDYVVQSLIKEIKRYTLYSNILKLYKLQHWRHRAIGLYLKSWLNSRLFN